MVGDRSSDGQPGGQASVVTSLTLLDRVRLNDAEAWERLADIYGPLVYHWCRKSRIQAADASDIVQEVFGAVASGIVAFHRDRPSDTFRGWLWTITRNKVRDLVRNQARQADAVGGTDAQIRLENLPEPCSDATAGSEDRHELGQVLSRALQFVRAEFRDRTWEAFSKVAIEGWETSDVAAELGLSENAVRQAKSRVLRRLRAELGGVAGRF